jgi:hypothetical protein
MPRRIILSKIAIGRLTRCVESSVRTKISNQEQLGDLVR